MSTPANTMGAAIANEITIAETALSGYETNAQVRTLMMTALARGVLPNVILTGRPTLGSAGGSGRWGKLATVKTDANNTYGVLTVAVSGGGDGGAAFPWALLHLRVDGGTTNLEIIRATGFVAEDFVALDTAEGIALYGRTTADNQALATSVMHAHGFATVNLTPGVLGSLPGGGQTAAVWSALHNPILHPEDGEPLHWTSGAWHIGTDEVWHDGNVPITATRWPSHDEVTGKPATATRWPAWEEVTGKPTSFPVEGHEHATGDITSGTLGVARGGTGIASYTTGNYLRASGATTLQQRTPAQVRSDIGAAGSGDVDDKVSKAGDTMTGVLEMRHTIRFGNVSDINDRTINTTVRNAFIRVQGGNLTNFGANLIMCGDQSSNPNQGYLRVGYTDRLRWSNDGVVTWGPTNRPAFSIRPRNSSGDANPMHFRSALEAGISSNRYEPAITIPSSANPRNFWIWNTEQGTVQLCTQFIRTHGGIALATRVGNIDRTVSSNVRNAYTRVVGGTTANLGAGIILHGDQDGLVGRLRTGTTSRVSWDTSGLIINTIPSGQGTTLVRDATGRVYTQTSTRRLKHDVEDADLNLSRKIVEDTRPVWYRSTATGDRPEWSYWGFVAEELAEVDPRLVVWGYHPEDWERLPDEDGRIDDTPYEWGDAGDRLKRGAALKPISVDYARFVVHLLNVVRDQEHRLKFQDDRSWESLDKVEILEGRVRTLSATIRGLETRITALEKNDGSVGEPPRKG